MSTPRWPRGRSPSRCRRSKAREGPWAPGPSAPRGARGGTFRRSSETLYTSSGRPALPVGTPAGSAGNRPRRPRPLWTRSSASRTRGSKAPARRAATISMTNSIVTNPVTRAVVRSTRLRFAPRRDHVEPQRLPLHDRAQRQLRRHVGFLRRAPSLARRLDRLRVARPGAAQQLRQLRLTLLQGDGRRRRLAFRDRLSARRPSTRPAGWTTRARCPTPRPGRWRDTRY